MIYIRITPVSQTTKHTILNKVYLKFIILGIVFSLLGLFTKAVVYAKTEDIQGDNYKVTPVCLKDSVYVDVVPDFADFIHKDYLNTFSYDTNFKTVNVLFKGNKYTIFTNASDVKTLLYKEWRLDSSRFFAENYGPIFNGKTIILHVKTNDKIIEYKDIPFNIETQNDPDIEYGKVVVAKEGKVGKMAYVYKTINIDGDIISKKLVDTYVAVKPQTEIRKLGMKKVYKTIVIDGQKIKYWRTLKVWATSYDSNCTGCSHYTATGKYLTKGIIAVDPKVIPLHTHLYVPGYGFGQAEDVGGAIKGNKIDLGFDDLSKHQGEWSARWVTIYILD